jgi:hypothetical protein
MAYQNISTNFVLFLSTKYELVEVVEMVEVFLLYPFGEIKSAIYKR